MARGVPESEKVTISLSRELLRYADQRAAELATSRSQVIAQALAERRRHEEEDLAREGYEFYAREAEAFAAATARAVSEALAHAG